MRYSKYNIINKLENSDDYILLNPLYGQADIIQEDLAHQIQNCVLADNSELRSKKYIVSDKEEKNFYQEKYLQYIEQRDSDEIQIFFVPWYACNFKCSYCYQDQYNNPGNPLSTGVVDAFFDYINNVFSERRKYVTLFGGEPLLESSQHRKSIMYFLKQAVKNDLDVAVVTNGYFLEDYLPLLSSARIREIQVTLDGVREVHDERRMLKNGQGSFDKIVKGIDGTLRLNLPVNLRVVVDKENINGLPELARFANIKGWSDNPLFKTQIGRNYELHHCQSNSSRLFDRLGLYRELYALLQRYPELEKFHQPAYTVSKFLFENGELPDPVFDACPGTKTEWAFDYTGGIYSCTATVGKPGEQLGTFYPEVDLKEEKVEEWEDRDVMEIEECRNCNVSLICGGGCGAIAKNGTGRLNAPDCRPVSDLTGLGISYYFNKD
jgi:uncharacterized protein